MNTRYIIITIAVVVILLVYFFRTNIMSWFGLNSNSTAAPAPATAASAAAANPSLNYNLQLQSGSSGAEVTELQNQLNDLGYGISVDGNFGPQTLSFLNNQLQYWGYQPVNSITLTQFLNDWNSPLTTNGLNYNLALQSGSTGAEVTQLQNWMNTLSNASGSGSPIPVSGTMDAATLSALQNYLNQFEYEGSSGTITLNQFQTAASNYNSSYASILSGAAGNGSTTSGSGIFAGLGALYTEYF